MEHAYSSYSSPPQEMMEKARARDTLFSMRTTRQERPPSSQPSIHTEFMGTDWEMEEDEIVSDFEDGENSPRHSVNSVR